MGTTTTEGLRPVALALVLVPAAGCLGVGADPLVQETVTVQPDGFYEVNLRMAADATIGYTWSVEEGGTAAFDLHSHEGDDVQVHRQATTTSLEGEFTAPRAGTYSLLWSPEGDAPIRVQLEITGDAEVRSKVPG